MTKPFVIPKALVWDAFQRVKANGGSAGVDDESIEEFEKNLGDNLYKLWNRMGSGSYFPPPVKAVPIPKKSGGTRMLGVPTVADRVAQTVVKLVLEPPARAGVRSRLIRVSARAIGLGRDSPGEAPMLGV